MSRIIVLTLVWSAALALTGCADEKIHYGDNRQVDYYDYCGQFTSCDQCTPMSGCGWCSYGRNQGFCFSEPNQCQTEQFSWTWVPAGCGTGFDSGEDAHTVAPTPSDSGAPPEDGAAGGNQDGG